MDKVTFSWKNYAKPTPGNLEGLAGALRRLVAVLAGFSIFMEANKYIPLVIVLVGALLDELKNFFAKAKADYEEQIHINIPESVEDKVTITHDDTPQPPTT